MNTIFTDIHKRELTIRELQVIPGVGQSIAKDLYRLGIRHVSDLVGKKPEWLYEKSNLLAGVHQDPCLLYVFRCAVYFAETAKPQKEKLKWWYWKDKKYSRAPAKIS
jgi:Pathogenicity locus